MMALVKKFLVLLTTVFILSSVSLWYYQQNKTIRPRVLHFSSSMIRSVPEPEDLQHPSNESHTTYIMPQLNGGIGNVMFSYAALTGIARQNKLRPVFPHDHYLRKMFFISAGEYPVKGLRLWIKYSEKASGHYDNKTKSLVFPHADMIEMVGYFQSWKYFALIEKDIRQEFTFRPQYRLASEFYLSEALKQIYGKMVNKSDITVIGVHVRRGDMLDPPNVDLGYKVAPVSYLRRAMHYFESVFEGHKLLFLVRSDDQQWVQLYFPRPKSPFIISDSKSNIMDLAILTLCDHIIMTVGTFGWWAGYLSGGQVIYYANFARNNSYINGQINPKDHFIPKWIPMR